METNQLDMKQIYLIAESLAKKYIKHCPPTITREDLAQEGILALLQKSDKFNPNGNYKFSTFAYNRIKWGIILFLKESHFIRLSSSCIRRKRKMGKVEVQIPVNPISDEKNLPDYNWENSFKEIERKYDVKQIFDLLSEKEKNLIEDIFGFDNKKQMSFRKIAMKRRRSNECIKRPESVSREVNNIFQRIRKSLNIDCSEKISTERYQLGM